jgi:hypothetical protein
MSLTGNISTMSLAEIFQWLHSGRKTGTLRVEGRDNITKDVFFSDGAIHAASSNDPRELIGQFLLNSNKISENQLIEALERQNRDHVMLGKILVQQKIINKDELMRILLVISEEIIYDLFLWKEGSFQFMDGVMPKREIPMLNLDITHLVLEGARREDEWNRIKDVFPDENQIVKPNPEKICEQFPLPPAKARLLALCNGNRSIYEITRLIKSTKFNVCRTLLDLYEERMIEVGSFKRQVIQPLMQVKRDPLREMLAHIEALLKQGRLDDAEKATLKLERNQPNHPDVKKVKRWIEDKKLETTAKRVIKPTAVPHLAKDVAEITKMDLGPEEGFIISRINGAFDVKSIIKISPFDEALCLKIFKQFMDDGVIVFK